MSYDIAPERFSRLVAGLVGLSAWQVSIGVGSFVTANFGRPIRNSLGKTRGEYYLWVYMAEWELEQSGNVLANTEDTREVMQSAVATLEGAVVVATQFDASTSDLIVTFDDDRHLRVVAGEPDDELWKLFLPDGYLLIAGSEGELVHKPANV